MIALAAWIGTAPRRLRAALTSPAARPVEPASAVPAARAIAWVLIGVTALLALGVIVLAISLWQPVLLLAALALAALVPYWWFHFLRQRPPAAER